MPEQNQQPQVPTIMSFPEMYWIWKAYNPKQKVGKVGIADRCPLATIHNSRDAGKWKWTFAWRLASYQNETEYDNLFHTIPDSVSDAYLDFMGKVDESEGYDTGEFIIAEDVVQIIEDLAKVYEIDLTPPVAQTQEEQY